MALIVICGLPCSGKSAVASALSQALKEANVLVIDEPSLHLEDRNQSYMNALHEKRTRGQLKSAVERALNKQSMIILDSLNCIKGYRYELHCIAKSAGTRYCVVHVDTPVERCWALNQERASSESYSEAVFDDLAGRFERPDAKNRWDSPLFTIKEGIVESQDKPEFLPSEDPLDDDENHLSLGEEGSEHQMDSVVRSVVAAMTGHPNRGKGKAGLTDQPRDNPHDSASASCSSQEGYQRASAPLTPSFATNSTPLLSTNTLHEMDAALQEVIDKISQAQSGAGAPSGTPFVVRFGGDSNADGLPTLQLRQEVSIAELRRHKRSFMKLATKVLFARLSDSSRAKLMFIEYLGDNISGGCVLKS